MEHQKHLGGPAADAFDVDELGNERFVVELLPLLRVESARYEMFGQIAEVFRLALGKSAAAQGGNGLRGDARRRETGKAALRRLLDQRHEAAPDGIRSLDRDLLPDNRSGEGRERIAAPFQVDSGIAADQALEHAIASRQRECGFVPIAWFHRGRYKWPSELRRRSAKGCSDSVIGASRRARNGTLRAVLRGGGMVEAKWRGQTAARVLLVCALLSVSAGVAAADPGGKVLRVAFDAPETGFDP